VEEVAGKVTIEETTMAGRPQAELSSRQESSAGLLDMRVARLMAAHTVLEKRN